MQELGYDFNLSHEREYFDNEFTRDLRDSIYWNGLNKETVIKINNAFEKAKKVSVIND